MQVFAADVDAHGELMETAAMLTRQGGALATYAVVDPDEEPEDTGSGGIREELEEFSRTLLQPNVFTTVVETRDFHDGVVVATQAATFAAGAYNTVMLGLPSGPKQDRPFTHMLADLSRFDRNVLLFKRGHKPWTLSKGPIVVWWGGMENNVRLMLILAYLLRSSVSPQPAIRLSTIVPDEEGRTAAQKRLEATLEGLRLSAETSVIVNSEQEPVSVVLARESRTAALVLLGMAKPEQSDGKNYLARLRTTSESIESVLFVLSNITDITYV